MPFLRLEDDTNPLVELRQVGANTFQLLEGFRYREPATDDPTYTITAHEADETTDLASVPPYLWWFVASYGKHTRSALMHDQLVGGPDRGEADRVFRVSLREVRVSFVRRWLMWTAVSLATMWARSKVEVVGFVAHVAGFFITLGWWLAGDLSWLVPVLVGLAGLLWGRLWPLTVVGVALVGPATLAVWITIAVVFVLDGVAWLLGRMRGSDPPPPVFRPTRQEDGN